uniref:RNA binding motif protein 20 n=1 Tax=Labrus bergylta TaxID=56723 RepID=A0A3Q3GSY5_9LABR
RGALEPPPPPTAQAQSLSVHNQQLFLSPASLQLAQLQAQLTLHRIKLAQGGNTAASALNQVLSNVAMSHPLFNQLRTSTLIGNPQGGLPTGMLGFPSSNSQLGALVGGGLNQNPANVRLNHPAGGAQQEYGKKSGPAYLSDTDRRLQFNTSAASASCDGQYSVINTLAKNMNNASFQKDFYGHDMLGQQADFSVNEQNMNPYNPSGHKEQWKGPPNLSHSGKVDMVSNATNVWTAAGQPIRSRTELYNPEEPTPDPKFNPTGGVSSFGSSSTQGFGGYQPMHGSEETLSSGARALQPYQVNDFHAVTPSQLPHQCSICDKKVYNLKDWNHHVKGKLHLQNRTTRCSKEPFPPRKATAGRVVHICNLPEGSCTENDVINLGLPFGKVTNYILMRSTHQAFLEMAYVDAAQAMVQYYQLTPAMISNQKLLIRMSKRYKELQLKKPGKDVQSIIQDISSHRDRDEMQELEHYMPERARSRSPISRSLSPHSHSPSFTSCSSAPSPQAAPCRAPERGSNGLGPRHGSWDWSSHLRRCEDERERDDPWRNGGNMEDDRSNGRAADRRKAYQKPVDHISSRSADDRGGGEGMRGNRDWHPRGSPQGMAFNAYRNMEDDFYIKEQMYKLDKPPRPPYQRHDPKPKRRDGNDYHSRPRHPEFEMTEEPLRRSQEDKRQSSNKPKEAADCSKDGDTVMCFIYPLVCCGTGLPLLFSQVKEWGSGDDTDEECWYPNNMEELVTVDEVGGEDDSIVEPDLPELEKFESCVKEEAVVELTSSPASSSLELQEASVEKPEQEHTCTEAGDQTETSNSGLVFYVCSFPGWTCKCCVCRPIGVEFIVPRSGFFCKLCGFFYTSEDTAKTSHCRSTVHYRNLQKYLSQLAEVSLSGALADPSAAQ